MSRDRSIIARNGSLEANQFNGIPDGERMCVVAREIRSSEWEAEVLQSAVPVLVDVFGTYCPPCRALAPTMDKIAAEYQGRAKVLKVDVEADRDLAGGLHVASVPTVIAFRDGKELGRLVGLRPEGAYHKLLTEAGVS
jgi:thioredoxin 1